MTTSEQARAHECGACGGSGMKPQKADPVWPFKDSKPCLVCLGSGRISDVMPVKDAMADALTATAIASHIYSVEHQTYGPAIRREALPLMWLSGGSRLPLFKTREDRNYNRALHAARAAFRAVPGLRG